MIYNRPTDSGTALGQRQGKGAANRYVRTQRCLAAVAVRAVTLLFAAFMTNSFVTPSALAQIVALPQPEFTLTDRHDMDLLSGQFRLHQAVVSIGSTRHPLTETIRSDPDGDWPGGMTNESNGDNTISATGPGYVGSPDSFTPAVIYWRRGGLCPAWGSCLGVTIGPSTQLFLIHVSSTGGLSTFTPVKPSGDTLVENSDLTYTFTRGDGTKVEFRARTGSATSGQSLANEIVYPDGRVITYGYAVLPSGLTIVTSVTRSDGLQLHFTYGNTDWAENTVTLESPTSVTAINNAYEYCSPTATTCALSNTWPAAYFSWSPLSGESDTFTVTDSAGRVTSYSMYDYGGSSYSSVGQGYTTIGTTLPSSTGGENITYQYCPGDNCTSTNSNAIAIATVNNYSWAYTAILDSSGLPTAPDIYTLASTSPVDATESAELYRCYGSVATTYKVCLNPLIQFTNKQGETFHTEDYGMEIQNAVMPEGNQLQYTWDARGNLTQVTRISKTGTSLPGGSAGYDTTCTNPLTCNEPNWVKDGKGNETDYTYNQSNGRVATVTRPPDGHGIRPQTNYTYAQQSAYVLDNSTGQYVASPPIWVRATESYCRTSSATTASNGEVSCAAGSTDEVLKTFYYGPNSGPNNLFLRGVAVTAAVNGVVETHVTCYGYDRFGNRISVTTPNAGLGFSSCDQFTAN